MNPPPPLPQPPVQGPVLAGFSGGLDSTVLLHLLAADPGVRSRGLRAIHVHHGLASEADAWVLHCERTCAELDVPLQVANVDVPRDSGLGLEGAARQARYQAFEDALGEGEILALGHHRDDQAETFLLRALRGSCVDGLRGMPAWRRLGRGWLWRPLLEQPREALLAHARSAGIAWIEDPSNATAIQDRDHLRLHVMPRLRERWPHADAMLARSAELAGGAARLLAAGDDQALADVTTADPRAIDVARLLQHPAERRARVLRLWLGRLGLPPLPGEGVARIESILLAPATDAVPEFAWAGAIVRRWRGQLHASRVRAPLPPDYQARWDGSAPLLLPTSDVLELRSATAAAPVPGAPWPLTVRARRGGERITLSGRAHSHALKNILHERAIPPWLRERMPVLCAADGTVLAAGDMVVSAQLERQLADTGLRLCWRCPDHN